MYTAATQLLVFKLAKYEKDLMRNGREMTERSWWERKKLKERKKEEKKTTQQHIHVKLLDFQGGISALRSSRGGVFVNSEFATYFTYYVD